jgi:hypothetical protein
VRSCALKRYLGTGQIVINGAIMGPSPGARSSMTRSLSALKIGEINHHSSICEGRFYKVTRRPVNRIFGAIPGLTGLRTDGSRSRNFPRTLGAVIYFNSPERLIRSPSPASTAGTVDSTGDSRKIAALARAAVRCHADILGVSFARAETFSTRSSPWELQL